MNKGVEHWFNLPLANVELLNTSFENNQRVDKLSIILSGRPKPTPSDISNRLSTPQVHIYEQCHACHKCHHRIGRAATWLPELVARKVLVFWLEYGQAKWVLPSSIRVLDWQPDPPTNRFCLCAKMKRQLGLVGWHFLAKEQVPGLHACSQSQRFFPGFVYFRHKFMYISNTKWQSNLWKMGFYCGQKSSRSRAIGKHLVMESVRSSKTLPIHTVMMFWSFE